MSLLMLAGSETQIPHPGPVPGETVLGPGESRGQTWVPPTGMVDATGPMQARSDHPGWSRVEVAVPGSTSKIPKWVKVFSPVVVVGVLGVGGFLIWKFVLSKKSRSVVPIPNPFRRLRRRLFRS